MARRAVEKAAIMFKRLGLSWLWRGFDSDSDSDDDQPATKARPSSSSRRGKKPHNKKAAHLIKLELSIKQCEEREETLTKRVAAEHAEALRARRAGNKARAVMHLKKRALHQKSLARVQRIAEQLHMQQAMAEEAQFTADAGLDAMQSGVAALSDATKSLDIDTVRDVAEESAALMQDAQDTLDAFSQELDLTAGATGDADFDLDAELAALDDEVVEAAEAERLEQLARAPSVPRTKVPVPGSLMASTKLPSTSAKNDDDDDRGGNAVPEKS